MDTAAAAVAATEEVPLAGSAATVSGGNCCVCWGEQTDISETDVLLPSLVRPLSLPFCRPAGQFEVLRGQRSAAGCCGRC